VEQSYSRAGVNSVVVVLTRNSVHTTFGDSSPTWMKKDEETQCELQIFSDSYQLVTPPQYLTE